jgi:hypothetical protein
LASGRALSVELELRGSVRDGKWTTWFSILRKILLVRWFPSIHDGRSPFSLCLCLVSLIHTLIFWLRKFLWLVGSEVDWEQLWQWWDFLRLWWD